jgi:Tfp pilus assembly protein PilE
MLTVRTDNSGRGLIEMLIVTAIVAVIFSIVLPIYMRTIEKTREISDTGSMQLAMIMGEIMHTEGTLASEPNQMFYDTTTGKISDEIVAGSNGRGTAIDAGVDTIYEEEKCGCNYDSTLSYKNAYLTIFYDETTQRVHVHWVDVEGAASEL